MNDLIKPHYENEDISRLNLCSDIDKWKSEVNYIGVENKFYKKIFSSRLLSNTDINSRDINFLQQGLDRLEKGNQGFLERLQTFINELDGMMECDDLECEIYYLNNHQKFKIEIENYFFENRNLKTQIYSCLDEGIKIFF